MFLPLMPEAWKPLMALSLCVPGKKHKQLVVSDCKAAPKDLGFPGNFQAECSSKEMAQLDKMPSLTVHLYLRTSYFF